MASSERAFVLRHTRLQQLAGFDGLQLYLSDDVLSLWHAVQGLTGDRDAPIPFWAFAWGGGLAIASYIRDHPQVVSGRRVLDVGSGSGLGAIVASRSGASASTAVDIDPLAIAAVRLNARANRQKVDVVRTDIRSYERNDVDVVIAGDCWYEEALGAAIMPWLQGARARGVDVLMGDPGRRYFPRETVRELASYEVRSTTDLEDLARTRASVFELQSPA